MENNILSLPLFLQEISKDKTTAMHPQGTNVSGLDMEKSVRKEWFFDVQWSDCPQIVEDEVKKLWEMHDLGNNRYIWKGSIDEDFFKEYPKIYFWLIHNGVQLGENVIIHWWW